MLDAHPVGVTTGVVVVVVLGLVVVEVVVGVVVVTGVVVEVVVVGTTLVVDTLVTVLVVDVVEVVVGGMLVVVLPVLSQERTLHLTGRSREEEPTWTV